MRKYFHCRYARSIGPKIQAFFEDYFAVPFPLPKQVYKKKLNDDCASKFSVFSLILNQNFNSFDTNLGHDCHSRLFRRYTLVSYFKYY